MPQPSQLLPPTAGNYLLEVVKGVVQPTPLGTNLSMAADGTLNASGSSGTSGLIGIQYITATGAYTYTPTAGTNSVIVEVQGPGGGSSGIASPGGGLVSLGRAGGGGGWALKRYTTGFSGATGVVGAKGTGGASGDNAGNNGTAATTFVPTSGTTITGNPGAGGNNGGSSITAPNLSNAVAGGTAVNGDVNLDGGFSQLGIAQTATIAAAGSGGFSRYSSGGTGSAVFSANATAAGTAATGKGGGGGAPTASGSGSAQPGTAGSDGMVIIWEYS